jgi:hypothetical protein
MTGSRRAITDLQHQGVSLVVEPSRDILVANLNGFPGFQRIDPTIGVVKEGTGSRGAA